MASWRDYARKLDDGAEPRAISAISADSPGETANSVPNGTNGTNGTDLPPSVRQGLTLLANAPAPRLMVPDAWPVAVADALRLASDGWAAKAMALGWAPLELFGAVPDPAGDPAGDGLAVWLAGRKLLAITGEYAVVEDVSGGRSYYNRHQADGAVLVWDIGRERW